ncbi:MAG: agmatine deiminase family protein [Planctomycetota bacterium]
MPSRRSFLRRSMGLAVTGPTAAAWAQSREAAVSAKPSKTTFRMPLESAPHERTFMQWPSNARVYGGTRWLRRAQAAIADLANTIVRYEPVVMLASVKERERLRKQLDRGVEHWDIPTDDLWCRDSGPTFVRSAEGQLAVAELNFNGWGNKQVHRHDGSVLRRVAERMGLPIIDSGIVGEGGGVETDGAGTLMAHESSWVNPNRNPGMNREEVEAKLLAALGAEQMIWAPGVAGADITDYHIDSIARFVEHGRVLIQLPDKLDPHDPWSVSAFETYGILKDAIDARGKKLEVVVLPPPISPRIDSEDFAGSYVNYYVCNGAVIASEFGDRRADERAAAVLAEQYPGREVVMLNTDLLGEFGGGIHCATQQQPRVD